MGKKIIVKILTHILISVSNVLFKFTTEVDLNRGGKQLHVSVRREE